MLARIARDAVFNPAGVAPVSSILMAVMRTKKTRKLD
jgi:hypothetical protein